MFVVEGDIDSIFLSYFMLYDPLCCLEDRPYPLTKTSGGATGNIQLHDSLGGVNIRYRNTGDQQETDEVDNAKP
jgi:hypothetical protein